MKTIFYFFPIATVILLIGCTEKPNSELGSNSIAVSDLFVTADTVLTAKKDTTYSKIFAAGFGSSTLVGNFSASEQITALYTFSAASSSYIDTLKSASLDNVKLKFYINYVLHPQKTFPIEFGIYEITKAWSQDTITVNSLPLSMIDSKEIGTLTIKDSAVVNQLVTAQITDTTVIRRWLKSYLDTTVTFHGFAIKAKPSAPHCVIGFYTFNAYVSLLPGLFIKYTRSGVQDSVTYVSGQDTYLAGSTRTLPASTMEVQGAFGVRSKIYFDISPLNDEAIINYAAVELMLKSSESKISAEVPDSILFFMSADSAVVDSINTSVYGYGYKLDNTQKNDPTYTLRVTPIVQRWMKQLNKNEGLSIRWAWEISAADKAVFYRWNETDAAKRPKLKIVYSKK